MESGSPITYVSHDEDGEWQFHSQDECTSEDDFMYATLGDIVAKEPSVLELADMAMGFEAYKVDGKWVISECEV